MELLTRDDIQAKDDYERLRPDYRRRIMRIKDKRRVAVGDHCSVHFESRDTVRYQVHEMLRIEDSWARPGAVRDEIEAYNPLVPQSGELSATIMFEYESPEERRENLPKFVGIERHVWLSIGGTAPLLAAFDRGQIDERGVSAVQYVKWRLDRERLELLGAEGVVVRLVIDHPHYRAQAVISEETRREIADDPR